MLGFLRAHRTEREVNGFSTTVIASISTLNLGFKVYL